MKIETHREVVEVGVERVSWTLYTSGDLPYTFYLPRHSPGFAIHGHGHGHGHRKRAMYLCPWRFWPEIRMRAGPLSVEKCLLERGCRKCDLRRWAGDARREEGEGTRKVKSALCSFPPSACHPHGGLVWTILKVHTYMHVQYMRYLRY